jgi:hypothetical protein
MTFIASAAFDGDDAHRPKMPTPCSFGYSTFKGVVVFANVERARLVPMLPTELTLAHNTSLRDLHPILHIAGLQDDTGWSYAGGPKIPDEPYREFILLIPFVLHSRTTQWQNFVVHMYLDHQIAMEIGKFFAYRKTIGMVDFDPTHIRSFEVQNDSGEGAFSSDDVPVAGGFVGNAAQARTAMANFSEMVKILGMPVLGVRPEDGVLICSYFDLGFDAARITAIDSNFTYDAGFDPPNLAPERRPSEPGAAILIENLTWKLQFPPRECRP